MAALGGRRDRFELADFVNLESLRDRMIEMINPILKRPWVMGGEVARDVEMVAGDNTRINHKLGRKPEGWLVVRQDSPALISEISADDETLVLVSDAPVVVTVRVY